MMARFYPVIALLILLFGGCTPGDRRLQADLGSISVPQVTIHRYDLDLFKVRVDFLSEDLAAIQDKYAYFLGNDLTDPTKLAALRGYLTNPRTREFMEATGRKFSGLNALELELTEAFRHYRYYYPGAMLPTVYTYISGGDYDLPVQMADSLMIIALDDYLGADFKPYTGDGLPLYRTTRMTPEFILPDCMKALADVTIPRTLPGNTLLDQMVWAGKRIYFVDALIPATDDRIKIGYSPVQYDWIVANEPHVWAAIIENRMLYTTDGQLTRTFMADGPFTAEFSKEAPARLGEWIGWKIVRGYMDNNPEVSLQQLFAEADAQKIMAGSGYKPKK